MLKCQSRYKYLSFQLLLIDNYFIFLKGYGEEYEQQESEANTKSHYNNSV
jgi:hypothetical protein